MNKFKDLVVSVLENKLALEKLKFSLLFTVLLYDLYLLEVLWFRVDTKDVLLERTKQVYMFYCSNFVVNSCFLISNFHKYHIGFKRDRPV